MSMRVERSTLEEVQMRFEESKRKKQEETAAEPSAHPAPRRALAAHLR